MTIEIVTSLHQMKPAAAATTPKYPSATATATATAAAAAAAAAVV